MAKKKHRSIEQFRNFVRTHPHIRQEVKLKQATWQELFEEWYILGDNHPRWEVDQSERDTVGIHTNNTSKSTNQLQKQDTVSSNQELISMLMEAIKNMDINQIQQYIKSANQAIGTIQGLLEMFQGNKLTKEESSEPEKTEHRNPFMFRKD